MQDDRERKAVRDIMENCSNEEDWLEKYLDEGKTEPEVIQKAEGAMKTEDMTMFVPTLSETCDSYVMGPLTRE